VVTAKTQYNLKNAREYFEEHLCVGDYYDEGQRVAGESRTIADLADRDNVTSDDVSEAIQYRSLDRQLWM
jgi:predicted ATPase with chaperone activity